MYYRTKGHQVLLDLIYEHNTLNNEELLLTLFYILKEAIEKTNLMIVEESKVLLPLESYDSELGGTIFFQLDSSHVSLHLYYLSHLLAIDVFGCGNSDIEQIVLEIENKIKEIIPSLKVTYKKSVNRFHH